MGKIKTNYILSLLIALSMLCYALRGNLGAILITLLNLILLVYLVKKIKIKKSFSNYYALFIFIFAFILGVIRTNHFEYYLFIGYLTAVLVLLNNNLNIYDSIWSILGKISLFEAIGVFIQRLFPKLYYSLISMVLPSSVVFSIENRLVEGYYTGFTREVSYTMFLIVIGLGIYLFDILKKDTDVDELKYKVKKYLKLVILFGALFISGKKAALLVFLIVVFAIQFIKSKAPFKLVKYVLIGFGGLIFLYLTFPIWSKINSLSRIVELLNFIKDKNVIGITNGRILIYQNAIDLWKGNKLFGIGWGNFKYMVNDTLWYSGFDVHNCYLQILCETGLIGATIFCVLTVISVFRFVKCVKKAKLCEDKFSYKLSIIVAYIQMFFIIYSFTEPILYEYTDYIIYFISINITNILLSELEVKKRKKIKF